jgi:IS30 family transposase
LRGEANTLNARARETLGWRTPAEALNECIYFCSTKAGVAMTT